MLSQLIQVTTLVVLETGLLLEQSVIYFGKCDFITALIRLDDGFGSTFVEEPGFLMDGVSPSCFDGTGVMLA